MGEGRGGGIFQGYIWTLLHFLRHKHLYIYSILVSDRPKFAPHREQKERHNENIHPLMRTVRGKST